MDDGGGSLIGWGALKVIQQLLSLRLIPPPLRTIRLVMFTNEVYIFLLHLL